MLSFFAQPDEGGGCKTIFCPFSDEERVCRTNLLTNVTELIVSFQNENRLALISALDETSSLFTGTGKISTLGNLHRGESLVSDVSDLFSPGCSKISCCDKFLCFQLDADSPGVQSTSSYQSASTEEEVLIKTHFQIECLLTIMLDPQPEEHCSPGGGGYPLPGASGHVPS